MSASYPLTLFDAALRGTLLALLLLLSGILLRDRPRLILVHTGVALCLGLGIQVFASTPWLEEMAPRLWQSPLVAISVGNAVLFWVFVQALFDDDFVLRPAHFVAWSVVGVLGGLNCALLAGTESIFTPVLLGLQRGAPLLFAALAAWAASKNWRVDLVEQRRHLRSFILIAGIAYTVLLLIARLGSQHGRLVGLTATADVLTLLAIVAVVAFKMLQLGNLDLFPTEKTSQSVVQDNSELSANQDVVTRTTIDANDERLIQALQKLMQQEQLYRSEDLTLATLAARMQLPEYRLRKLINQHLGYRNFNAYINEFRLAEARAALADPAQSDLPVLTIALTSGFQSIGPFNRAFKAATGLTPTEFRKENMAEN